MADSIYVKVGNEVEPLDLGGGSSPEYVERIEALEAFAETQAQKDNEQDTAISTAQNTANAAGQAAANAQSSADEKLPLTGGTATGNIEAPAFMQHLNMDVSTVPSSTIWDNSFVMKDKNGKLALMIQPAQFTNGQRMFRFVTGKNDGSQNVIMNLIQNADGTGGITIFDKRPLLSLNGELADAAGNVSDCQIIQGSGEYRTFRFSNGLQICIGADTAQSGNKSYTVSFNAAFKNPPVIPSPVFLFSGTVSFGITARTTTSFTVDIVATDGGGYNFNRSFAWIAIGQWK